MVSGREILASITQFRVERDTKDKRQEKARKVKFSLFHFETEFS
jgi:hypothetical protein